MKCPDCTNKLYVVTTTTRKQVGFVCRYRKCPHCMGLYKTKEFIVAKLKPGPKPL